jgi:hypothetical protein
VGAWKKVPVRPWTRSSPYGSAGAENKHTNLNVPTVDNGAKDCSRETAINRAAMIGNARADIDRRKRWTGLAALQWCIVF